MICAGCGKELFGSRRLCDACRAQADDQVLPGAAPVTLDVTEGSEPQNTEKPALLSTLDLSAPQEHLSRKTAGLFLRFLAGTFDASCLAILFIATSSFSTQLQSFVATVLKEQFKIEHALSQSSFVVFSLYVLVVWLYFVCCEASGLKASPGKRIFGLAVVDHQLRPINSRRAMVRNFHKFFLPLFVGLAIMLLTNTDLGDGIPSPEIICGSALVLLFAGIYSPVAFNNLQQSLLDTLAGTIIIRKQSLGVLSIVSRGIITGVIAASIVGIAFYPEQAYSILAKAKDSIKMPEFPQLVGQLSNDESADNKSSNQRAPMKNAKVAKSKSKPISTITEKQKLAPIKLQRWYRGKAVAPDPSIDSNKRHALPLNATWFQNAKTKSLPKMADGVLGYILWGNKKLHFRGAVAVYHPQDHLLNITLFEDVVTAATLAKHQELSSQEALPKAAPMRLQLKFSSNALHASNSSLVSHKIKYHPSLAKLVANGHGLPQIGDMKISGVLDGDGASIALACISKNPKVPGRPVFHFALAVPVSYAPDILALANDPTHHH